VPQFQVPEIFVEDEDDSDRASTAGSARARPTLSLTIPPNDEAAWRSGTDARDTPTSAGLRNRTESFSPRESPTRPSISPTRPSFQSQRSFQISPQLSPWRPSSSLPPSPLDFPSDFPAHDGILGGVNAGTSPIGGGGGGGGGAIRRSLSPVAPRGGGGGGDAASNRLSVGARRSTSTRDVLEVLEDSAWGESMRRSMTGARRNTRASSGGMSGASAGSRGSGGSGGGSGGGGGGSAGGAGARGGGVEGEGGGGEA